MERMLTWTRANPQFAAIGFFILVLALVMTILSVTMSRAGASLRPIMWFLGFVGIVGGPQAVVHLLDGFVLRREAAQREAKIAKTEPANDGPMSTLSPVPWTSVFGPDADPALISDAKRGLGQILDEAIEAKLSFSASGQTALAARFSSDREAVQALNRYGAFFALGKAQGSDAAGWTARRYNGEGEWVHVVTAGPELYAWTAADREQVIASRERALGPLPTMAGEKGIADGAPAQPRLVSKRLRENTQLMLLFATLNLAGATLWFFKGSAWAARADGSTSTRSSSEMALRDELLRLNTADGPTEVTTRTDGAMEINWRYADARWFDLMRVHQMKRAHRLVLIFDEANRVVRVREYMSALDLSVGARDFRLNWKMATGIQFFQFEHQRVIGAQFGPDGKPTGELSNAYTFDLQMLKRPYMEAITRAGWHWQPVTWDAPKAFRWLTE